MTIILTERANDWHAHLEGRPDIWGCGRTRNEALGDLMSEWPQYFDVKILRA